MRIGIIDDEVFNRLVLKKIITENCPFASIVVEDGSIESSISKINQHKPSVLLLDVEIKNGTSFDIIRGLNYTPIIIFTTAYEKYALQAIKSHAADYILKPINELELLTALTKCREKIITDSLIENQHAQTFFTYSTNDEKKTILSSEILYFEGSGAYVFCVTQTEKILLSKNIGEIEKTLEEKHFIRCHQSFIVNLTHVVRFNQKRNGNLVLNNALEIPVSQRKMKFVLTSLNKILRN
jgi:two-component system LytT family response regulator